MLGSSSNVSVNSMPEVAREIVNFLWGSDPILSYIANAFTARYANCKIMRTVQYRFLKNNVSIYKRTHLWVRIQDLGPVVQVPDYGFGRFQFSFRRVDHQTVQRRFELVDRDYNRSAGIFKICTEKKESFFLTHNSLFSPFFCGATSSYQSDVGWTLGHPNSFSWFVDRDCNFDKAFFVK